MKDSNSAEQVSTRLKTALTPSSMRRCADFESVELRTAWAIWASEIPIALRF